MRRSTLAIAIAATLTTAPAAVAQAPGGVPGGPPSDTPVGPPEGVLGGPPADTPGGPPGGIPGGPPGGIPTGPPGLVERLNGPPAEAGASVAFVARGAAAADASGTELQLQVTGGNAHARAVMSGTVAVTLGPETQITKAGAGVVGPSEIKAGDRLVVIWSAPFGTAAPELPPAQRVVDQTPGEAGAGPEEEPGPEDREAPSDEADGVTASAAQLRINQRISQAAVRRVNAIAAGELEDLPAPPPASSVQISLTPQQLRINQRISQAAILRLAAARAALDGLPVPDISLPAPDRGERIALTPQQLLINQRIAQAAVRRVNALQEELLAVRGILGLGPAG